MSTWLVIASATTALIYDITKQKKQEAHFHPALLKELTHADSRLRTTDLVSDNPKGRMGQGSLAPHSDPQQNEFAHFAKELGHFLDKEFVKQHYKDIVICAAPHFHGLLNGNLSDKVKAAVKHHVQKDYIPLPKDKLNAVILDIYNGKL